MASAQEAILVLEDGFAFYGEAFGAIGETFGEAVFATGMSGYQETLTDPSYHRQVVIATAPHIGNTGWNDEDNESGRIWVAGYVVRDPAPAPSNWRSKRTLQTELELQGVVGICGVDTRAITRHLRECGAMRVGISSLDSDVNTVLAKVLATPKMEGADLVSDVTTKAAYVLPPAVGTVPSGERKLLVAAVDLGVKMHTLSEFAERGIETHVLPADVTFADIAALQPDGVFFSNGPGDPATAKHAIALCAAVLAAEYPFFGICFGNQIFGLALGFDTYKLKYGHRGINQPVFDHASKRVDITAHNHGFALRAPLDHPVATPYGIAQVSHHCLNDNCVEGLTLTRNNRVVAFSVQYHPEAAAGPHDSEYLFDQFVKLMKATPTKAVN
ncbi:MAG: glutamine-hydrolyzing carbamoyl-phosphate synthase small subunit [Propionibacteriaceae bacterium]|jgi:carbamoyl-phosphate synthase small subunit|nr:glutamine-hydrolyzing carbamoyl-phosphate synthase small subunit [Propionibacteriaceae bacterium]